MKHRKRRWDLEPVAEPWTPFVRIPCTFPDPAVLAKARGVPIEQILDTFKLEQQQIVACWQNNLFTVKVYNVPPIPGWQAMYWLSIKRNDQKAIHDWRYFQRIKNEIVGPEHEAVELYPAESRLVDSVNQYHLYALVDENLRFPFGFPDRGVRDSDPEAERTAGIRQRPFGCFCPRSYR